MRARPSNQMAKSISGVVREAWPHGRRNREARCWRADRGRPVRPDGVDIPGLRPLWGAGQPKAPGQPRPPPSFMMGAAGWWLPRQAESCRGELPTPGETPGRAVQLPSLRPGSGPGCQTANRTGASGSLTTPGRRGAALHSPRGAESRPCGLRRNNDDQGPGAVHRRFSPGFPFA